MNSFDLVTPNKNLQLATKIITFCNYCITKLHKPYATKFKKNHQVAQPTQLLQGGGKIIAFCDSLNRNLRKELSKKST
jgi:hypothetical protein